MGIAAVRLYRVNCDICGKLFDNEEKPLRENEVHLYTTVPRAKEGIQIAGWVVVPNPPHYARIFCKSCYDTKNI